MRVLRELKELLKIRDYRKLLGIRITSQGSDGMFQAGLATMVLFSPESAATAGAVAGIFALMLLPFTIIGPWAGVFLDRWRRRQTLLFGNIVRIGLALGVAGMLAGGHASGSLMWITAAGVLCYLGANRFLLAGLSAGLPLVVGTDKLITANSITPTIGSIAYGVGGGIGLVLGMWLPTGAVRDATSVLAAAGLLVAAVLITRSIQADTFGPVLKDTRPLGQAVRELARGLAGAARHLTQRRTPAAALTAMALNRLGFGMVFMASLLIARNLLNDPADSGAGLATFGILTAISTAGFGLAVVLTPILAPRVGPHRWIALMLVGGAVGQAFLASSAQMWTLGVGMFCIGLVSQGIKIATDSIVQADTDDAYRGRAFAIYDMMFNLAFVGAAVLAALTLPDTGWSAALYLVMLVGYLAAASSYWIFARRRPASAPASPQPVS